MMNLRRSLVLLMLVICTACSTAAREPSEPTAVQPSQPQATNALIGSCPQLPADNIWNTPVDTLPVHRRSAAYINSIGPDTGLHMDFGSGTWQGHPIGIPFVLTNGEYPPVTVTFQYADESDPGPYRIPPNAPIEGGSDHHVLVVDQSTCTLYELFAATKLSDSEWQAGSGAIYDLNSNALRPAGWTSADAAGLPILPGLVRYDEVAAGDINHALRFTIDDSQAAYVWPARHFASNITDQNVPPMGQRFRLKANFDISSFSPDAQVILRALKTYGMIVADNGSDWYISGAPDENWDNDVLHELDVVTGAQFEAVDVSSLQVDADSGRVAQRDLPFHIAMPVIVR